MPSRVLLIQLGDIGDVVLTTPTVRAITETYPDALVSILVRKPFGELLAADPHLHKVIEAAKTTGGMIRRISEAVALARRLRRGRYDLVVDLRTGDRGAILSFLTGAPRRVGCQGIKKQFWHRFLYTQTLRKLHVAPPPVHPGADQSLRVVRELGITTEDSTPRLYVTAADLTYAEQLLTRTLGPAAASGIVTLNPFSRWKYKEWSNEKWGVVIDRIWESSKLPAVFVGSAQEAPACNEIIAGRKGRAFSLAGKTSLSQLAALISLSRLHLGVDSAAPHIAAAVGTPTVTIHGPTDWRGWRIVDREHRVVTPEADCIPCNAMGCAGKGTSQCLEELQPDAVIRAALSVLEQRKAG